MRSNWWITGACGAVLATLVSAAFVARAILQGPPSRMTPAEALHEYTGVYRSSGAGDVYVQLWDEFTGSNRLIALRQSGEVRVLHAAARDQFVTGPGAALERPIESRLSFARDGTGRIAFLTWRREGTPSWRADRVDVERHENVGFTSGDVRLAGTLIAPRGDGPHPAIVLVHGSGAQDRHAILPFARFLVSQGVALLGFDKRGVGESDGDWSAASFEDLARDVVAAADYLKGRADIDSARIGLLGVSQAGWIMPIAAARSRTIAFVISVSGAGVAPSETALDHARNEMRAAKMRGEVVAQITALMELQYEFARSGDGWDEYAAAREALATALRAAPPETFPGTPEHPYWDVIRRLYLYDPRPMLRQLSVPVLAIFGELDNNILPEKNKAAWEAELAAQGHRDYTLQILPRANHIMLEAKTGTNAEMASLRRFVPEYSAIVQEWLVSRFGRRRPQP